MPLLPPENSGYGYPLMHFHWEAEAFYNDPIYFVAGVSIVMLLPNQCRDKSSVYEENHFYKK